jgi:hypothetical protein
MYAKCIILETTMGVISGCSYFRFPGRSIYSFLVISSGLRYFVTLEKVSDVSEEYTVLAYRKDGGSVFRNVYFLY